VRLFQMPIFASENIPARAATLVYLPLSPSRLIKTLHHSTFKFAPSSAGLINLGAHSGGKLENHDHLGVARTASGCSQRIVHGHLLNYRNR